MNCKNCNNTLRASQKFCDECGAKIIHNRLKPKVLAQQINEQFISIDNKFLRTFIDLFKQPETVIIGYIEGTRKKYIDVLQYFAIALTLAGIQVFLMTTFFKEALDFGSAFMEGFNSATSQTKNPFADFNLDIFTKYQGLIYIISVPFSALGTWLGYYLLGERRYNFTEHLVINLYYSAQVIIVSAVLTILFLVIGLDYLIVYSIITIPNFIYFFYVLKRIFKGPFWEAFTRFIFVMITYFISFSIVGLIFFILGIIIAIMAHN